MDEEFYYGDEDGFYEPDNTYDYMNAEEFNVIDEVNVSDRTDTSSGLYLTHNYLACGINSFIKDTEYIEDGLVTSIQNKINNHLDKIKNINFLNPKMLVLAIIVSMNGGLQSNNRKLNQMIQAKENINDIIKYVTYLQSIKLI